MKQRILTLLVATTISACGSLSDHANLSDTTGRFDLTGQSYESTNGACLQFFSNEEAAFANGDDFRIGPYTWDVSRRAMLLTLALGSPEGGVSLPGMPVLEARWKSRQGVRFVELTLESGRPLQMQSSNCTALQDETVDPIEEESEEPDTRPEPTPGLIDGPVAFRILEVDSGFTEGSRNGEFLARNHQEWANIFDTRMNSFFDLNGNRSAAPQLNVDYAKEIVFGYQLVSSSVIMPPDVKSVKKSGNRVLVTLEHTVSGSGCYTLPAFSAPVRLLALPREVATLHIEVRLQEKVIDCR